MKEFAKPRNYQTSSRRQYSPQEKAVARMIGVIVAFFFVALALVAQNISYTAQENKVRDLITRKTNLDMDIAPYIIQENTLVKLSGVEDYARSSLNMDFPNEERIKKIIIGDD